VTSAASSLSRVHCACIRNARLHRTRLRRLFTCSTRKITREFIKLRTLAHRFEFDMRSQSTLSQNLERTPRLRNFDQFRA